MTDIHNQDIEKQYSHDSFSYNNDQVTRIRTTGDNSEYILIGRTKVLKSELLGAFGGTLNPGISAPSPYQFANPAPLGLCAFALTTFVLSLINARAKGVTHPNIVTGLALFYGGLVQLLAGMWEIALGNTFGGTALSSFGGFWLSFGAIQIPWFGIGAAYTNKKDLANAVGFYLTGWTIFTFLLLLCTLKSTIAFFSLFFFLDVTFLLLALGEFTGKVACTKAGGIFGVITALIAWYNAFAGIATKENSYFTAHVINLPGAKRV